MFLLTNKGTSICEAYIEELRAKRKEILDAGKDAADETALPNTANEIFEDALQFGIDDDGIISNSWGVTDNYDSDGPIVLKFGEDFIISGDTCIKMIPGTEEMLTVLNDLDNQTGGCAATFLEDAVVGGDIGGTDYAWGFFHENEIIGVCTMGYADDVDKTVDRYMKDHNNSEGRILSNVYVFPEYRGQGFALEMIDYACKYIEDQFNSPIFLTYINDGIQEFYKKVGFRHLEGSDNVMIREGVML